MIESTTGTASHVPYTEEERRTFRLFDGEATVYGDPSPVRRRLVIATGGKLNEFLTAFYGDDAAACAAAGEVLLPAVREAMSMKPFDPVTGQGATDGDVEAALFAFVECFARQKSGEEKRA